MNFTKETITASVKSIFQKLKKILIEIKSTKGFWLYIILAFVLTLVFLIFNFPYDSVVRNELKKAGEKIGRSSYLGNMDFSLIRGTKIDELYFILKDESEIHLNDVKINAGVVSALIRKSLKGNVSVSGLKFKKDKLDINGTAKSEFNLDFGSFSDYPEGDLLLDLQNVSAAGINFKGFDIPAIKFTQIEFSGKFEKDRLNISSLKFSGADLRGNLSGYITLAKVFRQSQLNLNISIDSSSTFLDNYRILLGDIGKSDKIQFSIRGTVGSPKYESNK